MKIVALVGSQRKNGNTARVVRMVEERIHALSRRRGIPVEFEILFLGDHDIRPCRGCRACFDLGETRCPLADDVPFVRAKMAGADALIVASPVYLEDVSGLVKNWMDRLAYLSHRPAMAGTCAFTLATVGGSTTGRTIRTMNAALLTWGCHLVGSAGLKMGALATAEELERFRGEADRAADRIFSAVAGNGAGRPRFVSLMAFRIQQMVWSREPAGSSDREYWQSQGWLARGCTFYMQHRASRFSVALARLVGAIVYRFVV